jgi:hypothetical protein
MKLGDILKTVGTGILTAAFPAAAPVIGLVNGFLPDDKKLPETATGDQVAAAVDTLPPDKRAELMSREIDLEETWAKEKGATVRAMLEADAKNPHTTRPRVVWWAFIVVAIISLTIAGGWLFAVFSKDDKLVKTIMDGWPFVVGILAPFIGWLDRYFGKLTREHKQRMDAANGATPPAGIAGVLASLIKR